MGSGNTVSDWWHDACLAFFTALGVVLGGSIVGAVAAFWGPRSPLDVMLALARSVKPWAIVVAMGGTFPTLQAIESGLLARELGLLARQLSVIVAGFAGAYSAYWLIAALVGEA